MEIQVDFEGRNPIDPDFDGIKTLLQQLFMKSHTDLDNLTDMIIKQNFIGSVIKQTTDDPEEDDEETDVNDVFGITTVINLSDKIEELCIKQLRSQLSELAKDHSNEETGRIIQNLLNSNSSKLGLLINERFINIPPQISVPLLENLMSEIKRAVDKKMPFDFTHYVLICKMYKPKSKSNSKLEDTWSNPEEEIFSEQASLSFEFSVENKYDSGNWTEEDEPLIPFRRVLVFEAAKLQSIVNAIKNAVK